MPKGRRARRVIRKIDTWSVLRLSLLFYLALLLTLLVAGVILWQVAATVGITDNLIKLIKKLGDFSTYRIDGGVILKDVALAGLILAVFGAFLNALMCVLYNLISDVVGGIRFEMFDEEVPARRGRASRSSGTVRPAHAGGSAPDGNGNGNGNGPAVAVPVGAPAGVGAAGPGAVDGNGRDGGRASRRERARAETP